MGETAQPFWEKFVKEKVVKELQYVALSPYNLTSLQYYTYNSLSPKFLANFAGDSKYPDFQFKDSSGKKYILPNSILKQYFEDATFVCGKIKTEPTGIFYFKVNNFYITIADVNGQINKGVIRKVGTSSAIPSYYVNAESTFTILKTPDTYTTNKANAYLHFVFARAKMATFTVITPGEKTKITKYSIASTGFEGLNSSTRMTGTLVVNEPGVSFYGQISSLTPVNPAGELIAGSTFSFNEISTKEV